MTHNKSTLLQGLVTNDGIDRQNDILKHLRQVFLITFTDADFGQPYSSRLSPRRIQQLFYYSFKIILSLKTWRAL